MTLPGKIGRRALLAAPLLVAAGPAVPLAARPLDRLGTGWWKARHLAKLEEAKRRRIDLILLGDSITENLESTGPEPWRDFRAVWARHFAARNTLNLGFKGDATSHLLWRMQNGELAGLKPRAAVILIGANNMGRVRWPAADNIAGIQAVLREARARLPATKLILLAVLPSARSAWVDETTVAINRALAANHADAIWHDPTHLFFKAGALDRTMFYDAEFRPPEPLIHPTPAAMAALYAGLEPALTRAMA